MPWLKDFKPAWFQFSSLGMARRYDREYQDAILHFIARWEPS